MKKSIACPKFVVVCVTISCFAVDILSFELRENTPEGKFPFFC